MSTESPRAACPASVCRNALIVVLLILLAITTTGWIVTATRDQPVYVVTAPAASSEPPRPPAPLPPAPTVEPTPPEMVEVLVAAKDLPVGTVFTRDELKSVVKVKKVPKDGLPLLYVTNPEELFDKRISRSVRAEETFNPKDVVKGGLITLPEGYNVVSVALSAATPASGFVGPGSRVDVATALRRGNKLTAFLLLVDVLVVAVDTQAGYGEKSMTTVSFAVTEKQALLLALARGRECNLELLLRHPNKGAERDKNYSIDEVMKLFEEPQSSAPEGAPMPRAAGGGR